MGWHQRVAFGYDLDLRHTSWYFELAHLPHVRRSSLAVQNKIVKKDLIKVHGF